MSKIKNGGLDQSGKCKGLTGSAVKGLTAGCAEMMIMIREDVICTFTGAQANGAVR